MQVLAILRGMLLFMQEVAVLASSHILSPMTSIACCHLSENAAVTSYWLRFDSTTVPGLSPNLHSTVYQVQAAVRTLCLNHAVRATPVALSIPHAAEPLSCVWVGVVTWKRSVFSTYSNVSYV